MLGSPRSDELRGGNAVCGLAGILTRSPGPDDGAGLERMTATLAHRGPDGSGSWHDAEAGIHLGHRRLAIIDLTDEGRQPMVSASGRYVIAFNGEIYNHPELGEELADLGHAFRGTSDTEVLLAALDQWGLVATLACCVGMFAFALWDRREHILALARDRLGEKPLSYGWMGASFVFGSELKALQAHPAWRGEIDRDALAGFMRYSAVPAPASIYRGVRRLLPGSFLTLDDRTARGALPEPQIYWSVGGATAAGRAAPFAGGEDEAAEKLDGLLRQSIRGQMLADVPIGSFLSGGIDSSAITAIMQSLSPRPVKTFCVGYQEAGYDESASATAVARHLGTEHLNLMVTPQEAREVIPDLPRIWDEPFADSSQIPTYLVSQLTRSHVTVGLTGDGGDEVFGGYNRHLWGRRIWRRASRYPLPLRRAAAAALGGPSPRAWNLLFGAGGAALPQAMRQRLPGEKIHKLAGVLDADGYQDMYQRLIATWRHPAEVVIGSRFADLPSIIPPADHDMDIAEYMMVNDMRTYLANDILVKLDRAGMAVSLETRAPYLDHRVVEFALSLPLSMKIGEGVGKRILRQVLNRYVPHDLVDRPKMGFSVPIGDWLRGPLRPWAEDLLSESRLRADGFLEPGPVRALWREHQSRRKDRHHCLWNVLMFQSWLDHWHRKA
ncbi:MAG: asparagine synthase (glutamine-hydrolyzing) [bacterium]|nr:asparagine synthase (glutamine-hydrolyzing) [bacterium]